MPLPEQMERLLRLEERALRQAISSEPQTGVYFPKLLPRHETRLIELWKAPQRITDAQASQLYADLTAGSIVDIDKTGEFHVRNTVGCELPLLIALHKYARSTPCMTIPFFSDLLKGYVFRTLSRLFEKYGWEAGEPDSSSIRPFREWSPEDSKYLIDMLDRLCTGPVAEAPLKDA